MMITNLFGLFSIGNMRCLLDLTAYKSYVNDPEGRIVMVVLAALIIFAVIGGVFVNYLRRNQNDIGGGLGKEYMKDHWGIDDDK